MFPTNLSGRCGRWTSGLALVMALVSGCGGSGGGSSDNPGPNSAPAANLILSGLIQAGGSASDVSASTSSELSLSGATSTDAEGDALTYLWTVTTRPATSKLALANATPATLAITPDVAGVYVMTLRVTDIKGAFSEKAVTITVRDNVAPVTNVAVTAKYNAVTTTMGTQGLNVGSSVVLDAKGSTDADGDAVTTTWTLLDKPARSQAALTVDGAISRFVADVEGSYQVRARGADAHGAYSDTIYVFAANNTAPKSVVVTSAIAPGVEGKSSMTAPAGYIVSMQGYSHTEANVTYAWELFSKPEFSEAKLTTTLGENAQITPDVLGNYVVKLTTTSSTGAISSHLRTIVVSNRSPVASIYSYVAPTAIVTGPTARMTPNTTVTLRSTNSIDADGDVLKYDWELVSKPVSSAATVSAATGTAVQMTSDMVGTYVVRLRATDPSGASSETLMTLHAGTFAPVAVIDKQYATILLGGSATASASLSFDEDSGPLSYAWAIDAAPAGSSATIASPTAADLAFTPDVAGNYVVSVTVSDGVNSNVAYLTIRSLGSMVANVELAFAPTVTRYSKGLDKLVILATNPNAVKIVDPFTAQVKTVMLPLNARALNLSPDGKLAVALQDGVVSLVDVESGTLIRSSSTVYIYSEAFVNNAGIVHMMGSTANSSGGNGMRVIDGRTGDDLSATLGSASGTGTEYRGVFSPLKNRIFVTGPYYSYEITRFDLDPTTGKVLSQGNSSGNANGGSLYLSGNEDLLFSSSGNYFRTDTLALAGKLSNAASMLSLSHSSQLDEALVMVTGSATYPEYGYNNYQASYKRYVGALFLPEADLALPMINGQQSFGIQIFHSGTGKHVALVQTMTSTPQGAGAKFYVVAR